MIKLLSIVALAVPFMVQAQNQPDFESQIAANRYEPTNSTWNVYPAHMAYKYAFQESDTISMTIHDLVVKKKNEAEVKLENVVVKIFSAEIDGIADLLQYNVLEAVTTKLAEEDIDENNKMVEVLILQEDLDSVRKAKVSEVKTSSEKNPKETKIENFESDWDDENNWAEDKEITIIEKGKKSRKRNENEFNLMFGINSYLTSNGSSVESVDGLENFAVKPIGSWYVSLNSTNTTRIAHPLYLEWGFGISWYNFKLQDPDFAFVKDEVSRETILVENPRGDAIKSKIVANHINASFVPMIDFGGFNGSKFRFGAGVYGGYRINSWTKQVFNSDGGGRDKIRNRDNYYLEDFRYGVQARLGFKGVDLFANYDLSPMFITDRGPELNALSFGLIF